MEETILREMIQQRDFTIIDEDTEHIVITNDTDTILVFIKPFVKFSTEILQFVVAKMVEIEISHSICMYRESITPAAKSSIHNMDDKIIELFDVMDLQYNITKHALQPEFSRLSKKEADKFKKEFGIKWPVMKTDDPVSLFYGYKKGDVIKIKRKNGQIAYRIVK